MQGYESCLRVNMSTRQGQLTGTVHEGARYPCCALNDDTPHRFPRGQKRLCVSRSVPLIVTADPCISERFAYFLVLLSFIDRTSGLNYFKQDN